MIRKRLNVALPGGVSKCGVHASSTKLVDKLVEFCGICAIFTPAAPFLLGRHKIVQ